MKRIYGAMLSCCLVVMGAAAVEAAETTPLGSFHVAAKVDSLHFTASDIKDSDADSATYVGLEGYGNVAPNLYLGGEVGYAHTKGDIFNIEFGQIKTEVTFVPVEVNLKYAVEASRVLAVDFGWGLSYNYANYRAKARIPWFGLPPVGESTFQDVTDWMLGAQLFADVNVSLGAVFIGLNGKVQVVLPGDRENFSGNFSYDDYTNWRVGGQIGVQF